ncbi:ROK family protein [Prosthecomicrobium pneumaticum]|uniref:Glucokinase n=1 Tax=Prosthecomicrobium pneumaticum TaxID=81895 RepID=A0A7W9CUS1_9HYPH|nr:ROK family protein [Prosthecomicrobium pneumaticum]MBB5752270.1 glucokinase [Prosthecomicrobium pneumaticum]
MSRVLALDLGGTSLRAATAPAAAPTALEPAGHWPAPQTPEALAARIGALLEAAPDVAAIGLTAPGLVEGTVSRWMPNLPALDGVDLAPLCRGLPLAAGNDAQMALVAEASAGAAKGLDDALLVAIGTGIGSAVLAAGRIVRGARGGACSFGWANGDPADPGAERLGWLERNAAGPALDRAARTVGLADGAALIAAARSGSPQARAAIAPAAAALGAALAGAVGLLDPSAVLLAGGVSEAADVLMPDLRAALIRNLPAHLRAVRVEVGAFGPRAGLTGAAIAATLGSDWWRIRR